MRSIKDFVREFRERYTELGYAAEEDQTLPSERVLLEVCEVMLNTSCLREEGRYSSFRVCFIHPESGFLKTYIYSHCVCFEKPIRFEPKELNRIAPALDANISLLMIDVNRKPYKVIGMIAAYTDWKRIVTQEISSGNRMPRIPNILIRNPGELEACFGETVITSYKAGECIHFRTDAFKSTYVADALRKGSGISQEERLKLLLRILWNVKQCGHGGHILIVPSAEACAGYLTIKYRLPCKLAFQDRENTPTGFNKRKEKEFLTYADMVSKLTMVDGAVVFTKDFDLLGFGAETHKNKAHLKAPNMCFINYNNEENKASHFNDHGMRHRSCYYFCDVIEGAVGIIFSQDGTVKACTKYNGKVYVYDHISLPLL